MPLPKTENGFDAAAYLAWEETQPERNEYVAGEVFAMVGVRQSHNVATLNLATMLRRELKGSPCRAMGTKCQSSRLASSKGLTALAFCASSREARNAAAAVDMASGVWACRKQGTNTRERRRMRMGG